MRRVIDDEMYEALSQEIETIYMTMPADQVSENRGREYCASTHLICNYIIDRVDNVKLGKYTTTTGTGSNDSYELIYTGNPIEEQIFGILHCTDNMFGSCILWVSDYDGQRHTVRRLVHGCDPNNSGAVDKWRYSID